jgi:threonine synthase
MVKDAFMDRDLSDRLNLTSANSISLGRLIPQSFYYIWAWAQMEKSRRDLWFCVPSGNFGNLTAGLMAHFWGMGNKGFIAATNINDVVPEYIKTGQYSPRASQLTLSNAMDVGDPSNFERMLELFDQSHEKMSEVIREQVVTDQDTKATIKRMLEEKQYEADPHTAVGYLAASRFLEERGAGQKMCSAPFGQRQVVTLSTAHPGKFSEVFEEAAGKAPQLPERLKEVLKLEKKSVVVENSFEALKEYLTADGRGWTLESSSRAKENI